MSPLKKLTTENTESTLVPAQVQAEFFFLILRVLCDLCRLAPLFVVTVCRRCSRHERCGKNPFLQ